MHPCVTLKITMKIGIHIRFLIISSKEIREIELAIYQQAAILQIIWLYKVEKKTILAGNVNSIPSITISPMMKYFNSNIC